MSPIAKRQKTVRAGALRWMWESDSNFQLQQRRDSIHSMTTVFGRCGSFLLRLKIQRMRPWWKWMALRNCIPLSTVRCMLWGQMTMILHGMLHTGCFKLQKPCTLRRWSEYTLVNGKPLVRIPKENAHLVDLKWTEDEQAKPMTLVEIYTSQGVSGAWRVHRRWLACFSVVLGDTKDRNGVSPQLYDEWPLDT